MRYVFSLFVLLFTISDINSTTMLKVDLETIIIKSEYIIEGIVESIDTESIDGRPVSYITIDANILKSIYKNRENIDEIEEFVIEQLGGTGEDGYNLKLQGMPEFTVGKKVILNIKQHKNRETFYVTAGPQGIYELDEENDLATSDTTETAFVRKNSTGELTISHGNMVEKRISDIKNLIARTVPQHSYID